MKGGSRLGTGLAAALLGGALAAPAGAQTGPELLRFPTEEKLSEARTSARIGLRVQGQAEVDRNQEDVQLNLYKTGIRRRLGDAADAPVLGGEVSFMDLQGDGPLLPDRLVDAALAGGGEFAQWGQWRLGATAGAGFAGDTPFSDEDAWYAKANLMGQRPFGKDATLRAGLNFDGNRTIFPDVPLPFFGYTKRASERLRYTLGIPLSAVRWKPAPRWSIRARYTPAFTINGSVQYSLTEELGFYSAYESGYRAYHEDGRDEHERLLFRQRRVEAGARWRFGAGRAIFAGGYAFDQEFERGFDVRDTDEVTELSDEPYVRAGLEIRF